MVYISSIWLPHYSLVNHKKHRARSAGATRLRRSAPRRGLGIFGTWPCARVVGLLNVSGGKASPRGTFAQRPWSWSGRGLKSPSHNHDSLETWPCVSLNAKSFFCLEGATSPAKPPSVPALNSTDFRFLFSSDCTASQAQALKPF